MEAGFAAVLTLALVEVKTQSQRHRTRMTRIVRILTDKPET
jgi:hypothetical protein